MSRLNDLEKALQVAKVTQTEAEEMDRRLNAAFKALDHRWRELKNKIQTAERELADRLIDYYGGFAPERPDVSALATMRDEMSLMSLAQGRLTARLPLARIAKLQSKDRGLCAQAVLENAIADREQQEALAALSKLAGAIGPSAEVELRHSRFQRRRAAADELLIEAARIRQEWSEMEALIEGRET